MVITIQQAIDTIIGAVPGSPLRKTVDTVTLGDPAQPLTGIVSTFIATPAVIKQAVAEGANLILSHENVFYNHQNETEWLHDNPVYLTKRRLIEDHHLVIWRFHDYLHAMRPDPTVVGLIHALEWQALPESPSHCLILAMPLSQLVRHIKTRLGLEAVRFIGNPDLICHRVGILPGFPGRLREIELINHPEVDVLISGEIHEWETGEYLRDASSFGMHKALIVTGHAASEEAGMAWIVPWVQTLLPEVPIRFAATEALFRWH